MAGRGRASPMRCSRNRASAWEGNEQALGGPRGWRSHEGPRASLLPTWNTQKTAQKKGGNRGVSCRHQEPPAQEAAVQSPPQNNNHQDSPALSPHCGVFLMATSGADCEGAMDVCFCVSHIHLRTFYIFIYKGLNKLFSASSKLKCGSCFPSHCHSLLFSVYILSNPGTLGPSTPQHDRG